MSKTKNGENDSTGLNLKALALSWGVMLFLLAGILSVWSRTTEIAYGFWKIYSALLPTPFPLDMAEPKLWKHIVGVMIDAGYAFLDGVILASVWGGLYNFFNANMSRSLFGGKQSEKQK